MKNVLLLLLSLLLLLLLLLLLVLVLWGQERMGAQGGHTGREVAFLHHVPHSFLLTSYSYALAALLRKLETNNHA